MVGCRIVWVCIDRPVWIIHCLSPAYTVQIQKNYKPFTEDVIKQLLVLLKNCKKLKSTDCVILFRDFNCEIQRNVSGCTGRWFMNRRPDGGHSENVVNLMRSYDLFDVDSLFRPKRNHMFRPNKNKCVVTEIQQPVTKKLDFFLVSNHWKSCVLRTKLIYELGSLLPPFWQLIRPLHATSHVVVES